MGGMTVSLMSSSGLFASRCGDNINWKILIALPSSSLATEKARALLPATYSREDAVANIQSTALLVAAFSQGRGELLRVAMNDRVHQPYRKEVCPLLPLLLPMAGAEGVLGVALSGAGPSVLLIAEDMATPNLLARIRERAGDPTLEVILTSVANGAACS
jgi:homoserine kinase